MHTCPPSRKQKYMTHFRTRTKKNKPLLLECPSSALCCQNLNKREVSVSEGNLVNLGLRGKTLINASVYLLGLRAGSDQSQTASLGIYLPGHLWHQFCIIEVRRWKSYNHMKELWTISKKLTSKREENSKRFICCWEEYSRKTQALNEDNPFKPGIQISLECVRFLLFLLNRWWAEAGG